MKNYLLFAGDNYYPTGLGDFVRDFDSLEECKSYLQQSTESYDWMQILSLKDRTVYTLVDMPLTVVEDYKV